jgi:hypothetical protein
MSKRIAMSKNINLYIKTLVYSIIVLFVYSIIAPATLALEPASTNFKLQGYGFGSGGGSLSSTNYQTNGLLGETEFGKTTGLTYLITNNVPGSPTLAIPANNYDRIQFVINTSNNPTDTTYAIAISTDNFVSDKRFVKSDGTVGSTLTTSDYKTGVNWYGSYLTYGFITGLTQNTTYYIKVKARQGNFSESGYGPTASITTGSPTLTLTLSNNTLTFANLNSTDSYNDSSQQTTLTTSTNAYGGYKIYGRETNPLTFGSSTIPDYISPNSAPTTWSGTGFGYSTNDTNLGGTGGTSRFSGSKYAGFVTSTPGDIVADDTTPIVTSQISNEVFAVSYRVTANSTTPAGTYKNTIIYTIVPTF